MIRTARQQFSVRQRPALGNYRRWIETLVDANWMGAKVDWDVTGDPALAFVQASSWVAKCPDCPEQIIIEPNEPFYCPECRNVMNGHKARPVEMPDQREQIEALLLKRPLPYTRNWVIGETVEQLEAENKEHGV